MLESTPLVTPGLIQRAMILFQRLLFYRRTEKLTFAQSHNPNEGRNTVFSPPSPHPLLLYMCCLVQVQSLPQARGRHHHVITALGSPDHAQH